jgi:hypothetical protein
MDGEGARQVRVLVLDEAAAWADGLGAGIERHTGGRWTADVTRQPSPPAERLATMLAARPDELEAIDVAVLSIACGLAGPGQGSDELRRAFVDTVTKAVDVLKAASVTVLLINGSTVGAGLDVARLNLACLQLSVATGVSIIDVDRMIAELGGDEHVIDVMRYGPIATGAIADEVVRVLDDYGFFDERPLLAQIGVRRKP